MAPAHRSPRAPRPGRSHPEPTGSALPPSSRICAGAASISAAVRAASTTCAPACASAAAAARPMPRPAPVTSARRPSRRSEGVRGSVTGTSAWVSPRYRALKSGSRRSAIALTPFAEVLGVAQPVLLLVFALGRRGHRLGQPAPQSFPRRHDRQGRRLGDLCRQFRRPWPHLVERHAVIRQTDRQRLLPGQPPSGIHQQRRLLRADQPRQRGGQPETRDGIPAG